MTPTAERQLPERMSANSPGRLRLAHVPGDRAHQLETGLHFRPPVHRGRLDHLLVDGMALPGQMFP